MLETANCFCVSAVQMWWDSEPLLLVDGSSDMSGHGWRVSGWWGGWGESKLRLHNSVRHDIELLSCMPQPHWSVQGPAPRLSSCVCVCVWKVRTACESSKSEAFMKRELHSCTFLDEGWCKTKLNTRCITGQTSTQVCFLQISVL